MNDKREESEGVKEIYANEKSTKFAEIIKS